jgi:hypothetical protein
VHVRCLQAGERSKLQKISSAERARLNKKYGQLPRVDSFPSPDFTPYNMWELGSGSGSDTESASDTTVRDENACEPCHVQDDIFAVLGLAKKVREQEDLIEVLHTNLERAEARACAAEARARAADAALVRAAERCADAVRDALAPGVSHRKARKLLTNIGSWVLLEGCWSNRLSVT